MRDPAAELSFPWIFGLVAVSALIALVAVWLLQPADRVDHVTVTNPSDLTVTVAVSSPGDGAVVPLGEVAPGDEREFRSVLDQGSTWRIVVLWAAQPIGQVDVARADLAQSDWRVVLSDELTSDSVATP